MQKFILCPDTVYAPDLTFYKTAFTDLICENGEQIDTKKHDISQLSFMFEDPKRKMSDYTVSDMGCSVVSERLKSVFDDLVINNIEYLSAKIMKENLLHSENYFVANIIGLIDCIDFDASDMDMDYEQDKNPIIYSFDNLCLKDCVLNKPILRLKHFTRVILTDETLKHKIEAAELTGIKFIKPENWDGFNGEKENATF